MAYEYVAAMHDRLEITDPLSAKAGNFFNRPFLVIELHGKFAAEISRRITDPAVKRLAQNFSSAVSTKLATTPIFCPTPTGAELSENYMSEEKIINSSKAPEPVGLYPHARRVGNLLFLSGVGPRERGTKKIPGVELDANGQIISYDIETQCRSVFQNVRYILEDAGSGWEKIVDVTVFLTNMKDDFQTYNRIYAEYFKDNLPCRTTVEINCLPTPIAIELKVIATIG